MQTVKKIKVEMGEECSIDIDMLHDTLSKLPMDMYMNLYNKMQTKIYGYPQFSSFCGGCGTGEENKPEIKVHVDHSEVDEAQEKINELADKLESVNEIISKITGGRISIYASFADDKD